MNVSRELDFGHRDRKDIYEYVERHGSVDIDRVRRELFPNDERRFRHQLALLKRDGYVEQEDDELRVVLESMGEEEEFEEDGVNFSIRPARQEDLGGVVGVIRQVTSDKTYIEAENVAEALDHQDVLLRHNELESRTFFVAVVDDEVVGWAHVEAPEVEKLGHNAELTFGVLDDYRGMGIGDHLFRRATEWARSEGYEKVYQSVPATNEEAVDYLESRGCYVDAVRENHYKIDGDYVDEVMLALEL
ncbi:MAG: N-acetyltransferase family protein [Halobacteriales archaeon]